MTDAAPARRERARESAALGARILERIALGASLDAIARQENLTPREADKSLRAQLAKRAAPDAEIFVKLQIVRLEAMIARLSDNPAQSDIDATAALLKVFERLDRYYGFGARASAPAEPTEIVKRQIIDKLNRMAARSLAQSAPAQ
jgi:hypothetical protein